MCHLCHELEIAGKLGRRLAYNLFKSGFHKIVFPDILLFCTLLLPVDLPLHDDNEMVWYRLGERNVIAEDRNNAISVRANNKKQNALNLSDNWDLVAILIVALIGGFAVGYFCGKFISLIVVQIVLY